MAKGRDKRRRLAKRKKALPIPGATANSGDSTGADDPYTLVYAPIKPRPYLNSGAIALPEPQEVELSR